MEGGGIRDRISLRNASDAEIVRADASRGTRRRLLQLLLRPTCVRA